MIETQGTEKLKVKGPSLVQDKHSVKMVYGFLETLLNANEDEHGDHKFTIEQIYAKTIHSFNKGLQVPTLTMGKRNFDAVVDISRDEHHL